MPAPSTATRELTEFARVYRENFAFVWRSLRRLGVPERDLPDATHDVFLVAHARFADFDGRHRVSTWLFAIGLRVASDRRRKASTRYEVYGEEREPSVRIEPDPTAERRAMLQRCLDAMPLEQRAVFVLFELEGMTGEEIARLLEIPTATVHSRLRLARETFRRTLGREQARERFELARLGETT